MLRNALVLLSIAVTFVMAGQSLSMEKVAENTFYIRVFDRLMPIPARFVLITDAKERYEFNSISTPGNPSPRTGFIRISKSENIESIKKGYSEDAWSASLDVVQGIAVVKFTPRKADLPPVNHVLMHDSRSYVLVVDHDPELWRRMLTGLIQ